MPVEPQGTFSVITPKLLCTVLLPQLFCLKKEKKRLNFVFFGAKVDDNRNKIMHLHVIY